MKEENEGDRLYREKEKEGGRKREREGRRNKGGIVSLTGRRVREGKVKVVNEGGKRRGRRERYQVSLGRGRGRDEVRGKRQGGRREIIGAGKEGEVHVRVREGGRGRESKRSVLVVFAGRRESQGEDPTVVKFQGAKVNTLGLGLDTQGGAGQVKLAGAVTEVHLWGRG